MKPILHGEKLPNRFVVSLDHFRKFNWRERIQILFGYNAVLHVNVKIDKRTQEVWENTSLVLTKEVSPQEQVRQEETAPKPAPTVKLNGWGKPCGCRKCSPVMKLGEARFIACPICGNKRCPHASDHAYKCTGSNDPGQVGSVFK